MVFFCFLSFWDDDVLREMEIGVVKYFFVLVIILLVVKHSATCLYIYYVVNFI